MKQELLRDAGIDYDGGVRRFMGRAALYEKTLRKFPGNDTMSRVRADYAGGDRAALLRDCHEFKGMCGNISMTRLYLAADAVVRLLRSDAADEALFSAMGELEREYAAARAAVLAAAEAEA